MIRPRRASPFSVVVLALALAGCGPTAPPTDGEGVVVEIPPDGTFAGTTCAAIGREFGAQLDAQVLAIIEANRATPGNASDPISTAVIRLMQGAALRVRELGLTEACDAPEFLAAADEELSAELRASVGEFATTPAVTFEAWHDYVAGQATIIDLGESP